MRFPKVTKYVWFFILIISVTSCGPVHKQIRPTADNLDRLKKLAIVIPTEPDFTVIYHRAKATAAPGALFGLVGAAVASGYNESLDNKKTELIDPYLDKFSCRLIFVESVRKTLNDARRFTAIQVFDKEIKSKDVHQYDAVVTFSIQNWGLRLADRENDKMAAFIELEVKMIQTSDGRVIWDEREVVLGNGRHPFELYQEDKQLVQNDLEETVEEAGFRTANLLIYP